MNGLVCQNFNNKIAQ